jgi:hypothetical protein
VERRGGDAAPPREVFNRNPDFIGFRAMARRVLSIAPAWGRGCIEVQPDEIQPEGSTVRLRLRRTLLSYWVTHPEAKDTAAGIRLWWFGAGSRLDERAAVPDKLLREELEELVRSGWAIGRGAEGAQRVFALNPAEIESIKNFLEDPANLV